MNTMMKLVFSCCCFLFILPLFVTANTRSTALQHAEVQRYLSRVNKPFVKSIKSPDGDIIDCVLLAHQPAFDHPQLKNHTIQRRPSYHPEELSVTDEKASNKAALDQPIAQLWHLHGSCPEGTIPIRRTRKEDVLRASSVEAYMKKAKERLQKPDSVAAPNAGHKYAVASVEGEKYYGTRATFNLWKPRVEQNELSVAQLWISGESDSNHHTIEAGWEGKIIEENVYPNMYHDFLPRLFNFWTDNNYQSGCYNLLCPGFIQTSRKVALGSTFTHLSTYNGTQYDVTILIWKDPHTQNWWLQVGADAVGYWPSSLVPLVSDGAESVKWGGEVFDSTADGKPTTTEMGSGHFPAEGYKKASFIRNLKIVDGKNKLWTPRRIQTITPTPGCYNIKVESSGNRQTFFYYGGPGENPSCY